MTKAQQEFLTFNRGRISRLALGRLDLKRTAVSASIQTNWMPRALGSMMLRPGLGYVTSTRSNLFARQIPFVFSSTDTAMIEATSGFLRVLVNDEPVTRVAVSSAIANGAFETDLTSWTDADEGSAASTWATGGYMQLVGTGSSQAIRRQQVTVASGDRGDEHALRIVVQRGPVTLRVGSTSGGDEYITETALGTGTHSLAFTPTGDFYVQFSNAAERAVLIDSVAVEGAGVMTLPTPWEEADLRFIRCDQSGDVIFAACAGHQQRRIERRGTHSWSIVLYQPTDGPFRVQNTTPITIASSGLSGNVTLTASRALFKAGHVGALFSITSVGQNVAASISAENTFTNSIRVTGVGTSRTFSIVLSGTWTATVTLQRSYDDAVWADVGSPYAWTANTTVAYEDGLDNQIVYYRVGVKTGDFTSGTVEATLAIGSGSIKGVVRVTDYSSPTSVGAEVLSDLGGTSATDTWAEGAWSDLRGWPSAVRLHDGRLVWAGNDRFNGSITDAFDSFDEDFEGDAGPLSRSIGSGPVDTINWLASMNRLMAGTDGSVVACKSNSLDEPLTPTNFTPKIAITQGSARIDAVKIDDRALFVQQGGFRVFELARTDGVDYSPEDLSILCPEIGEPGIVGMAVQRKPDTRVHCWRSDGTVAVLVFDRGENVLCWVDVETDGEVEDVAVLPGEQEDAVYYIVKRTIDGSTVRYVEKWAMESECIGGTLNKVADSFVTYSGSSTSSITGLSHLEGQEVVVWADGRDLSPGVDDDQTTYTVISGAISLGEAVANAVVGLPYKARFKSTKLAYSVQPGESALGARKRINSLGLLMVDTHPLAVQYGPDFDRLDDMPMMEKGAAVDTDAVWDEYDSDVVEFGGQWDTDSRLCLQAHAPRCATILAAVVGLATNTAG